jgi:glycosyltransferase involved in cell wall biosynthesis
MRQAPVGDQLTIAVTQDRYSTRFSTPKHSRHIVKPTKFLPTHRILSRAEGVTWFWPTRCDLIHSVNRIPMSTNKNFVISFESHLPRYFGGERTKFFAYMRQRLADPSCRRIIAWSHFARRAFAATHAGAETYPALMAKLDVVYPNIVLPACALDRRDPSPLKLVFVGAHFGRKGGAVAARAAELARRRRLPLHFHIISALEAGGGIWSDPRDKGFFDRYFKLLDGENVTFQRSMPNEKILEALRAADFSILTTLSDTFGFSAVESLAVGTPVLATPQGALPEFIVDGQNGLIVPLDVDPYGEWIHVGRSDKDSRRFETIYEDEIERMAFALIEAVSPFIDSPAGLATMRANARATAEQRFDSRSLSPLLDQIYEECAGGFEGRLRASASKIGPSTP